MVGASNDPRKWGFVMLNTLIRGGYQGNIYPVNPDEDEILGLKVYNSIAAIPEAPDLAVIVVPAASVNQVIRECVDKGVRSGIVITAGFAELGEHGAKLQEEIVNIVRAGGMILVGPNCNGIMNPRDKLHVQFVDFLVPPGPIAVVAQSGNVLDSVVRQVMLRGLGCSLCIASGNEADLHIEDYLEYLGEDPNTRVILSYIEGFKDGKRFIEVAREVSKKKPIVMVKVGKTDAGAKAAMGHTAAIAGSDTVFDAVCHESGVIRAKNLDELVNVGIALLQQPLPKGCRVGIMTGGGGWGVLAADACNELGLKVVTLPQETIRELDTIMPAWWNRSNPVDLVAGSNREATFKGVEILLRCPIVDGVMMMSIMPALGLKRLTAAADEAEREHWQERAVLAVVKAVDQFNNLAQKYNKPVVVATEHMLSDAVQETRIIHALGQHNSICHQSPHQAAAAYNALVSYGEYLMRNRSGQLR
jgi:acyl-CoA synthetase (NDP forming)